MGRAPSARRDPSRDKVVHRNLLQLDAVPSARPFVHLPFRLVHAVPDMLSRRPPNIRYGKRPTDKARCCATGSDPRSMNCHCVVSCRRSRIVFSRRRSSQGRFIRTLGFDDFPHVRISAAAARHGTRSIDRFDLADMRVRCLRLDAYI